MEALVDVIAMGLQAVAVSTASTSEKGDGVPKPIDVRTENCDKRKSWADLAEEQETLDAEEMVNEVITEIEGTETLIGGSIGVLEQPVVTTDT